MSPGSLVNPQCHWNKLLSRFGWPFSGPAFPLAQHHYHYLFLTIFLYLVRSNIDTIQVGELGPLLAVACRPTWRLMETEHILFSNVVLPYPNPLIDT
jgi:hypothetical protein